MSDITFIGLMIGLGIGISCCCFCLYFLKNLICNICIDKQERDPRVSENLPSGILEGKNPNNLEIKVIQNPMHNNEDPVNFM
jgi:hypothetical protein